MTITSGELLKIFPSCAEPDIWASAISKAWNRFGFTSRNARAGFLGIIGNETGGLREVKRENMNYSPARARTVFGSVRADRCIKYCTLDAAGRLIRDDRGKAFANCIYANMIGNGPESSGDGWSYRGLGLVQLTGRGNYAAAAAGLGLPVEGLAERAETDPVVSAAIAAWFMARYVKIMPLLDSASEADFRAGAARVGHSVDDDRVRLSYRAKALAVVLPANHVRTPEGNIMRTDLNESGTIADANKGITAGTVAAGAGAAAPVITKWLEADLAVAIVFGVVVLLAGAGVLYYFLSVKKRRRRQHEDGIA
jgi:putative chitinase